MGLGFITDDTTNDSDGNGSSVGGILELLLKVLAVSGGFNAQQGG